MKPGIIAAFILLAAGLAAAQTNSQSSSTNPPPHPPLNRNIPVSTSPLDRYFTADQRKVFDQAYLASQGKIKPLSDQIRQLRNGMSYMMFSDKFDEAAFRAKSEQVGKLQTQIDLLMAQAVLAVRPLLSSNQVEMIRGPQLPPPPPPAGNPVGNAPSKP